MLFQNESEVSRFKISDEKEDGVYLILASEHSKLLCRKLCKKLKKEGKIFLGGYFPQIIHEFQAHTEGVVLSYIKTPHKPILFKKIGSQNFEKEIQEKIYKNTKSHFTCLAWIDGLSPFIHKFLTQLYSTLGPNIRYLGGGAGSLSLKQEPCIFNEEGEFEDAAVLLLIEKDWSLDVKHGWESASEEIVATEVEGNTILKLNWLPALEVYQDIVSQYHPQKLTEENFFDIAKNFPLGLCKDSDEYVVRDPIIMNKNGSITCVGNVSKGSKIQVLTASKKKLIDAAADAARTVHKKNGERFSQSLIIDCISRTIYLGESFDQELWAARDSSDGLKHSDNFGALTLGEIASSSNGYLEFYNKSFVIGATGDEEKKSAA